MSVAKIHSPNDSTNEMELFTVKAQLPAISGYASAAMG